MLVDKITLQDIGLYDTNESIGLITHLNFCKTNGGKAQLDEYLLQPLSSIAAIEQRQEAIKFYIEKMEFLENLLLHQYDIEEMKNKIKEDNKKQALQKLNILPSQLKSLEDRYNKAYWTRAIMAALGMDYHGYNRDVNTMNTLHPQIEQLKKDIAYWNQYK